MNFNSISNIKRVLDISNDDISSDEVLCTLLNKSELYVRCVCGISEKEALCDELINLIEDICVASYNKLGSEGFKTETIGSIKIDYSDLPGGFNETICRHKKIKF